MIQTLRTKMPPRNGLSKLSEINPLGIGASRTSSESIHCYIIRDLYRYSFDELSNKLLNSAYSVEVQYFGANVLHYKIANCWNEIPQEQIADLRQTLMETGSKNEF
jgi:hypothetical protein